MPASNARNVALTAEQNAFVESLVRSGRYASASEVVRAGLRLLEQDEQTRLIGQWLSSETAGDAQSELPAEVRTRVQATLRAKIREGLAELNRGESIDGEAFFSNWQKRLESALRVNKPDANAP